MVVDFVELFFVFVVFFYNFLQCKPIARYNSIKNNPMKMQNNVFKKHSLPKFWIDEFIKWLHLLGMDGRRHLHRACVLHRDNMAPIKMKMILWGEKTWDITMVFASPKDYSTLTAMQYSCGIKMSWVARVSKKKKCVKGLIREAIMQKGWKHWYGGLSLPIMFLFIIGWQKFKV